MTKRHRPRRGSLAFSPRKRALSQIARVRSWISSGDSPRVGGFAGYKAGMTHIIKVDDKSNSLTEGTEISVPVTVIETPPMKIDGIRCYSKTAYGLRIIGEVHADDEKRDERLPEIESAVTDGKINVIRVIVKAMPKHVKGVPKKKAETMEINIVGGSVQDMFNYSKSILGGEMHISDVFNNGDVIDVSAVTKGKGTQGPVKRWGTIIQDRKAYRSSKGRHIGNIGPWHPARVRWTVPQLGQTGYHQRTEFNKRIMMIGDDGESATPDGGFTKYGVVTNPYVIIKGSVPGPSKRLVRMRGAIRPTGRYIGAEPDITYISLESKQG